MVHRFSALSTFIAITVLVYAGSAFANSGITYQGRILKPDGTPLNGSNVQFKLQIRTPDVNNCLMYEEVQTLDMHASNGVFALTVNDGSGSRTDLTGLNLDRIFSNAQGTGNTFSFNPATCTTGSTYLPNSGDGRNFVVSFKDETMASFEPMPAQKINFVPLAFEAKQVAGFTPASLVRVAESDGTLDSVSPLSNANYTELLALIGGTSSQYAKQSAAAGTVVSTVGGTGDVATPAAGSVWLDTTAGNLKFYDGSSIKTLGSAGGSVTSVGTGAGLTGGPITTTGTISLATLGVGGTGFKVTYDTYGRVTGAVALVEADIPTLTTAGHVSGSAITSGTIAGNTAINTTGTISSGAITSSGLISSPSLSSTAIGTQSVQIFETTNSFKVSIVAPASLGANYTLTLPTTAGSSNQVLTTNGSGVLTWTTPAGTGISTLTSDVSASGTGSVAATVNAVGGVTAANVASGANLANAGTNLNTASTLVKRDASGNFAASAITHTSSILKDTGANTVTLQAPTTVTTSYVLKLPPAVAASAGQYLSSDTSGNLSWSTLPASMAPSGAAGGDLGGTYPNPTVTTVGTSTAANVHAAELAANAATAVNTVSTIVKRDGSGNFAAGTGTFNGLALNNAGSILNIVNPVGGAWTMTLPATAGSNNQVLTTNGTGLLSWTTPSGGGLTNFTDAINTAAPNATIPVASLTATNAASDVDVALVTKGLGALVGQVPDGTTTGGNKRGNYAVDWQHGARTSNTQVASGHYSVISGGYKNTASGLYGIVVGGSTNTSSNQFASVGGGNGNTASAYGATVTGGTVNTASGSYSTVMGGNGNTASAYGSSAVGTVVTADSYAQTTIGAYNMPVGTENALSWVATDPLFVIGNGTGSGASRSTALMVLKNGNVGIGTTAPAYKLDVNGAINATAVKINGVDVGGGGTSAPGFNLARAATTTDITLSGTQTIDGVAVVAGDRVLVKNQIATQDNGMYVVSAGAWTRATDMNTWAATQGYFATVTEGTVNVRQVYQSRAVAGGTLGTTAITFGGAGGGNSYGLATGSSALIQSTGMWNSAYGNAALASNTTGTNNTGIGYAALNAATTATQNTALGYGAMAFTTTGGFNVAVGSSTMYNNSTGNNNVAVGYDALSGIQTGDHNTALGDSALGHVTTGIKNTGIGYWSGNAITTGSYNVVIGSNDGSSIATSNSNIIISDGAGNIRLDVNSSGYVGIGTTAPGQMLSVAGTVESTSGGFKFPDGTTQTTAAAGAAAVGANTQVQYNSSGAFAASSGFTFNGTAVSATAFSSGTNTLAGPNSSTLYSPGLTFTDTSGGGGAQVSANLSAYYGINFFSQNILTATMAFGKVGIGTTAPTQLLTVNGNVLATAYLYSSDRRLKKDITPLEQSLEKVLALNPVRYHWISPSNKDEDREQLGLIAQDVQKVYPQAVTIDQQGWFRLNYPALISPLIGAVQELYHRLTAVDAKTERLQKQVQEMQEQNAKLAKRLDDLEKQLSRKPASAAHPQSP